MPEFVTAFASMRLRNEEGKSVFSVTNVSPTVTAETAAAFVGAVETIYNNGPCTARLNIVRDLEH